MVTYRLDEILLATLALVLWGADDFDAIELSRICDIAKAVLGHKHGVAKARTVCEVFRLLKPEVLNQCFGACVASR